MRPIDADALKAKAFGKRGGLVHTSDVDDAPTVEAVPVEWLRKWPKSLREGAYVRDILRDWHKEQEAKNGKTD